MPETRKRLAYREKLQVIDLFHQNKYKMSMDAFLVVLRREGFASICAQTVYCYIRSKESIHQHLASNPGSGSSSRQSSIALPNVEEALREWIKACEHRNLRLTGILIREKARRIAQELGIPEDKMIAFSDGWLSWFKARSGLKQYIFHGEAASAPTETLDEHREDIKALLAAYPPENRFNFDETGLNWRHTPGSGLATHAMAGVKVDKTRLTYTLCTSAAGEKLTPFVIGYAAKPRCFTHSPPSAYGFLYRNNKTAWMVKKFCLEYISLINKYMARFDRHILLLCDNCSSHCFDLGVVFSHVKIVFLPPNLTSWLQPMDAGIICTFKANYRRLLSQHALDRDALGEAEPYNIHQLDAMQLAAQAWDNVSPETIQNCWRHTGICPDEQPLEERLARAHL